jgi:GNAT superfamily N-acetyltransferase
MPTVRRAAMADIETLINLRLAFIMEAGPESGIPESEFREMVRGYLAEKLPNGEFLVWLAEEDGQAVGCGALLMLRMPPTAYHPAGLVPYLLNMYTRPEWRGRGIATALVEAMIAYVKTTPAKFISLHAMEKGRGIYERLGFIDRRNEMVLAI